MARYDYILLQKPDVIFGYDIAVGLKMIKSTSRVVKKEMRYLFAHFVIRSCFRRKHFFILDRVIIVRRYT